MMLRLKNLGLGAGGTRTSASKLLLAGSLQLFFFLATLNGWWFKGGQWDGRIREKGSSIQDKRKRQRMIQYKGRARGKKEVSRRSRVTRFDSEREIEEWGKWEMANGSCEIFHDRARIWL